MRRLSILAAVSLVFVIAIALLWWNSGNTMYGAGFSKAWTQSTSVEARYWFVQSARGRIGFSRQMRSYPPSTPYAMQGRDRGWRFDRAMRPLSTQSYAGPWHGFEMIADVDSGVITSRSIHALYVPHWFLLLAGLVLPSLRYFGFGRAGARRRKGFCIKCGYDLRASADRCPECGTPLPAPAPNALLHVATIY